MADKTGISWTDATWNPMSGCTRVSPGCSHCYIDWAPPFRIADRHFRVRCPECDGSGICEGCRNGHDCAKREQCCPTCGGKGGVRSNAPGSTTGVALHPERLDQPLRWARPRRIFVNSLSDLFHEEVPDEYVARIFAVMAATPRHTFQVLTKRHGRMKSLLNSRAFREAVAEATAAFTAKGEADDAERARVLIASGQPLPNVWLGVTVEDQTRANLRIPALMDTPAAHRFLSCEPLLGPVDFTKVPGFDRIGLNLRDWWVIVGGESGKDARPMHPDWARTLRDQCQDAGVPFFFKQWGEWAPVLDVTQTIPGREAVVLDGQGTVLPLNQEAATSPGSGVMVKVGKRSAGTLLDGVEHHVFPNEG